MTEVIGPVSHEIQGTDGLMWHLRGNWLPKLYSLDLKQQSTEAIPPHFSGICFSVQSPEDMPGLHHARGNITFLAVLIAEVEPNGIYF